MGYEAARSTQMLATHCFACRRPLRDSVSVEVGMGPVCRKKAEYDKVECAPEDREKANSIIHNVSKNQTDLRLLKEYCMELSHLGFIGVAKIIVERLGISICEQDEQLLVKTPFSYNWVNEARKIPGRKFDFRKKVDIFPKNQKVAIYKALCKVYKNSIGIGPKGFFIIGIS